MSEEIKNNEEKNCCVCKFIKCESCKKFLIVALGTFVGGFCALSLFAALHKPPMVQNFEPRFQHDRPMMERGFEHRHHFKNDKHPKGEFKKAHNFEEKAPDEAQKTEI